LASISQCVIGRADVMDLHPPGKDDLHAYRQSDLPAAALANIEIEREDLP
jgi:hypothetical protein